MNRVISRKAGATRRVPEALVVVSAVRQLAAPRAARAVADSTAVAQRDRSRNLSAAIRTYPISTAGWPEYFNSGWIRVPRPFPRTSTNGSYRGCGSVRFQQPASASPHRHCAGRRRRASSTSTANGWRLSRRRIRAWTCRSVLSPGMRPGGAGRPCRESPTPRASRRWNGSTGR